MEKKALKEGLFVDFSLKIRREIDILGVKYWRCGLVAVGKKNVFVAVDDVVRAYEKSPFLGLYENTFYQLRCQIDANAVISGEIDTVTPLSFNSIKVGYLGNEQVLVCCTDSGYINVWFTDDLSRSPLIFNTGRSAWGIAIHTSKRLLAISSNSHDICLWSLGVSNPFKIWDTTANEWPRKFSGHDDNIPSICFNQDGTILSSVGIDATCRVWDVASGTLLHVYLDFQRGWFVGFIDCLAFKVVKNADSLEKHLNSVSNQVTTCTHENYANDRNMFHLMDDLSDNNDERQSTTHNANTDSLHNVQRVFLDNFDIQELFQSRLIWLNDLNFSYPIKYDDFSFSSYISAKHKELLFYGTEKNVKLCSIEEKISGIQLLVECRNLFDNNDDHHIGILRHIDRINMVEFIPDLSMCIVASQKGKACLMYLVKRVMNCDDGSILLSYSMIADRIFPENPPSCGLLGMTVEKIHLRHYKLYMLYYDGTLMLYEIKKHVIHMVDVDELML
ncbi:hypothetical protein PORY_001075 [Pneumocystis oryctolagi]|uniref:Uncharacterized protein n=1 Tax=Pneumocystis oryctolagi TaxID=42067 RepID=A0ACB7CF53_9ASCO|nr:hypothetical protein PORY_001075 [Pneumocystis oryctolagi]